MNEQLKLFEDDQPPKLITRRTGDPPVELIPCPFCNKMPKIWISSTTGGKCAKCPECGYMVHTLYDINEHWYNCNVSRKWRIEHGKIYESDCYPPGERKNGQTTEI